MPGEEKLAQSSGHVLCCCCCFLKEGSVLQNNTFARCAAESPTASPTRVQRYSVCHDKKKLLRCWIMTTDPSSIEIFCELRVTD